MIEQKEKHLNRFCKTCFNSGINVGRQEARKELDKETKRGNFWAKKYQDAQKDKEKIENLAKICCKWNKKKLEPNEAFSKIWNLFEKECLKEWNK